MSNGEANTRDQRVLDAYHAASDALDEQPSAGSRAAILAAAARAVEAQPQDAATGMTARRPAKRAGPFGPSQRPLALVATFLVAAIAVGLAMQTREQRPLDLTAARVTPQPSAAPPAEDARSKDKREIEAAPEIPPNVESKPVPDKKVVVEEKVPVDRMEQAPAAQAPVPQSPAPARRQAAPPAAKPPATVRDDAAQPNAGAQVANSARAKSSMNIASEPAQPATTGALAAGAPSAAAPAAGTTAATAPAAPAPPPSPAPALAAKEAIRPQEQAAMARTDQGASAETDAPSPETRRLAKARPVERSAAIAGDAVEADPARWAERIVALRDAGRDEDADRELAKLRERYPDFKVPPNALRRAGTR